MSEITANRKDVYTIIEATTAGGKGFWLKIGSAFVNRDGSINVNLQALPVNGKLHIRDAQERQDYGSSTPVAAKSAPAAKPRTAPPSPAKRTTNKASSGATVFDQAADDPFETSDGEDDGPPF